jgi:hypothetical protein
LSRTERRIRWSRLRMGGLRVTRRRILERVTRIMGLKGLTVIVREAMRMNYLMTT